MHINLDDIRKIFARDLFAADAGIRIDDVREDGVTCSMDITERHLNAAGIVQGGAIFTLTDMAFGVHSNLARVCGGKVGPTVGQSCSISYLGIAKGRRLIASSTMLSKGRKVSVYRVTVKDELGNRVADMVGNAYTFDADKG
ncbi:MAG: PaaI family thioesterase [Desulfovibrio sp.]|jgi:acyl-CoA thioesterase|nr:PaaI family thioesterase [Desulfovibrio sp.]